MNEIDFHRLADDMLGRIYDALEPADAAGKLEVDYQAGIMNVILTDGRQFIVNKHAPSRQIWLSSPLSGGLHFSFDAVGGEWKLPDGKSLADVLATELKNSAAIEMKL